MRRLKSVLIKTEKLCKTFSAGGLEQQVLKNLDLEIYEGDFTVIMGASGAGKSTLLYALSGMDKPECGSVNFLGEEITSYSNDALAKFRRVYAGFVFQQAYFLDNMSVLDNVLVSGLLITKDKKKLNSRAETLFKAVGLDETAWRKFPAQLSGGEVQRAALVRALINNPRVVFADEPTGSLNSKAGRDVLDCLTEFNKSGQSIVMVTHDINSARRAKRILYIKDGSINGTCELGDYTENDKSREDKLKAFLQSMGW